jgi:hypothetical protein
MGQAGDMKHPSIRGLFAYWNERRGDRSAPERGDIEPGAIRHLLSDSFILAFEPSREHPFRLAGTRVCSVFGRELRGEPFVRLWQAADHSRIGDLITIIADEGIGAVAGATGKIADGASIELELILLPLRHRGNSHARILGMLALAEIPHWLGRRPLNSLILGPTRHLDPAHEAIAAAVPSPHAEHATTRHGLTVYEGGRA